MSVHTHRHDRHACTCAQRTFAKENAGSVSNECRCSFKTEGSRALIASVGQAISGIGSGSQRIRQVAWKSSTDGDDFEMAASEAPRGEGGAGRWREGGRAEARNKSGNMPLPPRDEAA